MRNTITIRQNQQKLNWSKLLAYVLGVHLAVIGSAELVCYALTGGPSPLVAGFGLVASLLFSFRRIGEEVFKPADLDSF